MKEHMKYLDCTARYRTHGLSFQVTVRDFKMAYGDMRFLIRPVSGYGEIWVSSSSLGLPEESSLKGFNQPKERE